MTSPQQTTDLDATIPIDGYEDPPKTPIGGVGGIATPTTLATPSPWDDYEGEIRYQTALGHTPAALWTPNTPETPAPRDPRAELSTTLFYERENYLAGLATPTVLSQERRCKSCP